MTAPAYLLLIEDNPADVALVRRAAIDCDPPLQIEVAASGEEGLEFLLGHNRPAGRLAAVLVDLRLPGISGFELLDVIRHEPALLGTPVVVFSGSDEPSDVEESYRRGASSYIRKPTGHRTLVAHLQMLGGYWISVNIATVPQRGSGRGRETASPTQA